MDILSSTMEEVSTKEKLKMMEMENSNLKSKLMQLEAQVNEGFHMKLQKDIMDKKLSGLQMEMLKKQRRIRKLKFKTSMSRQAIIDKDSSLQKMMQHIKKNWILLLEFGNKLRKNGLLTIEEKNNIKNEYEEWVTLMVNLDKGETEEVFKMLNELPTSLFEVLNISECCSEINPSHFSNEENVTSSLVLSTPNDKVSNSIKSLGETGHKIPSKLDKKPQNIPDRKAKNCDQVVKKTKRPQHSRLFSRIDQYKAILRKNSSFSDNSLILHSNIVSKFQSKAAAKTSKNNKSFREYPVENKRTAILLPGLPLKTSQKSLVDEKDTLFQDSSSLNLSSEDSSKEPQLSKSQSFHTNKRQKVSLNASILDKARVQERRTLQNRLISGKQKSHTENHNEITGPSECNTDLSKSDQILENESDNEQNNSKKMYTAAGKPKTVGKETSKSFEKTSSVNVIENRNKALFDSRKSDSTLYNHSQFRANHEHSTQSCLQNSASTTKDIPKILKLQSHIPNRNESHTKEQKLLADKKITAVNTVNKEHVSFESEPTKNNNLSHNNIPCLSFKQLSRNKDLCQTNCEMLDVNTESTFFNSKLPVINEEVSITTNGRENSENKIERNSKHLTSLFTSKNFNGSESCALSDEKWIKNVGNIKMGFPSEKGYSVSDSDSECDLVIDEDFDNGRHLISKETHNEAQEKMKMGISNGKYSPDCDPDYQSVIFIAENLNTIEQESTSKVKDGKSHDTIRTDINGKESDSYLNCNLNYSKEETNSSGFIRNTSTFSGNFVTSTTSENTERKIISTCHNKAELVASKDFSSEQIAESSKIAIKIDHKLHTNSVNEQITPACVNEESTFVDKTFDVGAILKLQSETFNFKSKKNILEKDLKKKSSSPFFKKENSIIKPDFQNSKKRRAQQKRKNMRKNTQAVGMNFADNSLIIEHSKLQSENPNFNSKNQILKKDFSGEGSSTFSITENSKIEPNIQSRIEKRLKRYKKKQLMRKKQQVNYTGNPLHEFFQDFKKIKFHQKNFEQNIENLFLLLIDPSKTPNNSSLLFHVLYYLKTSKGCKNLLLSHSPCEDLSVLFPLDENCIVTTLFLIELENKPHLEGLLNTAMTTFHHIIISKKKFGILSLASFCRVFTQICKCQGNNMKPVLLCGDLLKMKHQFAPYLIASVASVWKELFQIGNNLPAEEMLFHSSILYGASKKLKSMTENNWNCSIEIISKCFTALPVNDARSAIRMLMELIQQRCKDDSWNNHYLATSLIILVAQEDWDWTKEFFLDKYVIPNLTKYGSETLNENAFDFYCNMYVDALLLKPGNPLDTVLTKFFDSSEIFEGGNSIQDSAALCLMRFVYLKNRQLPPFLSSWFKNNCEKPKVQQIRPYFQRRVIGQSLGELREEDVLCIQ